MRFWLIFISVLSIFVSAQAQEMNGYVPPPLFSNSHLEEPDTRPENAQPVKQVERLPEIDVKAPLPARKPLPPIIKYDYEEKENVSTGVVKGPKTMPAVKKKSVEVEATFTPGKPHTEDIMKRHQEQNKKITIERIKSELRAKPEENKPVISDKIEWVFLFSNNQIELDANEIETLTAELIPTFKASQNARLIIHSEGLSQDSNVNASRRLALNRALEIRKVLIEEDINPNYIDVIAIKNEQNAPQPNIIKILIKK